MNPSAKLKLSKLSLALIVAVVMLIAGVAWALLQSQGTVTGNTITTASANLLVSTDGVNYSHSVPGFNFSGVVPGGYPAPKDGYSLYLKNSGSTPLDLSLALSGTPSDTTPEYLPRLNVLLTDVSGDNPPQSASLALLFSGNQPLAGELAPGAVRQYKFQTTATADATPGAEVDNIDLAFTGTARDPNDPNR